uniref:Threonylcarbamoyl-AMP synthase n=1 Tax=uncultured Thiotrichaceae bacterium TaxID=298394 RepID=A0A6S6UK58_9GAMM|nr:MAG: TsaC protein (YrdC domain) required for threonylcarbamoyladenosine t(6)A37 modification in tRNA [uncultured Thiotrichaceae bacterium]
MKLSYSLDEAIETVKSGGILAYPTEAVFGLGCDPRNLSAVQRLLGAKHRPADKGLILLAANIHQLNEFVPPLPEDIKERILDSWPGPVTWLLPVHDHISPLIRGNFQKIAVRVSNHPVCSQLCQRLGHPIISTSANITGKPAAISVEQVIEQLGEQIDLILDKPLGGRTQPSEIRDAFTNKILRAG